MGVTFCCNINDFCALAWPRQFRDQCTPDLLTLRDAYKADLVMHYPGLAPGDLELHLAITTHLVGEIENELTLRGEGGVDLKVAAKQARRYPTDFVQRVRMANDLMRVIVEDTGHTAQGAPAPGRVVSSFRMRSPFRQDETPSFHVYTDGHYYDYGTQEWGDVFTYITRRHHVSFGQALEYLALRANIPMPVERTEGGSLERWSRGKRR